MFEVAGPHITLRQVLKAGPSPFQDDAVVPPAPETCYSCPAMVKRMGLTMPNWGSLPFPRPAPEGYSYDNLRSIMKFPDADIESLGVGKKPVKRVQFYTTIPISCERYVTETSYWDQNTNSVQKVSNKGWYSCKTVRGPNHPGLKTSSNEKAPAMMSSR